MKGLFRLVLVLVAVWALGFAYFFRQIPAAAQTEPAATDAVVVLTGGSQRLPHGLHLLNAGLADKLLISGVDRKTTLPDLLALYPGDTSNIPAEEDVIILDQLASDTLTNAEQTARWMEREQFASLRLVTASYHMPRSLLIFAHYLPDTRIVPEPVFPKDFHRDGWWRDPTSIRLVMIEYHKYLGTWLSLRLAAA